MFNPSNASLQASKTNDFPSRLREDFNLVKNAPKVLPNVRRANLQPDEIRLQNCVVDGCMTFTLQIAVIRCDWQKRCNKSNNHSGSSTYSKVTITSVFKELDRGSIASLNMSTLVSRLQAIVAGGFVSVVESSFCDQHKSGSSLLISTNYQPKNFRMWKRMVVGTERLPRGRAARKRYKRYVKFQILE